MSTLNTEAAVSMKAAVETINDVLAAIKGLPEETVDAAKATGVQNLVDSATSFADVMPVFIKNLEEMSEAGNKLIAIMKTAEQATGAN